MRSHYTLPRRFSGFVRFLCLAFAMTVLGLNPQIVSALEATNISVETVGYNLWLLTGSVDEQFDIDEYATITLGGILEGESTTTTAGSVFEYYFEGHDGDVFTFVVSTDTEQSEEYARQLSDPNLGAASTLEDR